MMLLLTRISTVLLLSLLLSLLPAFAFDTELSDTAVREAYFLGQRHDQKSSAFLANYSKHLPLPKKGPYVSEIRLLTPLAQVVEVSSQHTAGYSAQQAQLDYHDRGDTVLVEIHIEFTPTYNQLNAERSSQGVGNQKGITLRTEDFWQEFHYGLKQKEDWIEPRSMHGEPVYAAAEDSGGGGLIGAWIWIEYGAHKIASDDAQVHALLPEDQDVSATFDLSKLH